MLKTHYWKKLVIFCLLTCFQLTVAAVGLAKNAESTAKYVFLFIGDGMGYNQVQAAEKFFGKLAFTDFAAKGALTTYSADHKVTDSAAAATALASGNKTNNGYLGVTPQDKSVESIAAQLKRSGFKIGIITSVQLNNATPGGFYAHQKSRKYYYNIAKDLTVSNFDYFAGGALVYPFGQDGIQDNIWETVRANGYRVVDNKEMFGTLDKTDKKVYVRSWTLYDDLTLPFAIDKDPRILADLTTKGADVLYNVKGFFMMVEGGKIDYAGHTNDIATNIKETKAFSDAVNEAVEFYKKYPKDTLIVVTADHETGGMSWTKKLTDEQFINVVNKQNISYEEFGKLVKCYVRDGNSGDLADWLPALSKYFGLDNLSDQEYVYLQEASYASIRGEKYGPYEPLMIAACKVVGERAGVTWSTYGHSSTNVPIYAIGANSNIFAGEYDNTQIPIKILAAMKQ